MSCSASFGDGVGEQKLVIAKQRGLTDFGGFCVGIEGVSTQSSPYWHCARRCLGEETGSRNCRFLSVGVLCTVEQKSAIKIKKFK